MPSPLALWQAAPRVDPPVKPEGYGEGGHHHVPPFVIPRLDRGIQGGPLRPCRMALDPAIKSRGDTVGGVRWMASTHTKPSAHGMTVAGTGEQDASDACGRQRKKIGGSQASGASRADGCQRWPDRGGAGITLRVQPREPCFHPPHFGTGLDAVGPAFSGRDRVRDTTAHPMRTRYLRIAAKRAHPTFPRGRLSPSLPGIRPPAQVRSARLPVWREVMQRVCGKWQGAGIS